EPAGPAELGREFNTPSLDMRSGPNTVLTLLPGGLMNTSAQIGTIDANPYNAIPDTQPGWNAVVNFNGGQIAGSWNFLERSVININSDHALAPGVWSGTVGLLNVNDGKRLNVASSVPAIRRIVNKGTISL